MRKGFTLIELVVAVALLSMVLSFAGVIFNVSIESHRTARANAEITRKLRAITDQLNTDFAGIQTDAPLLIWFERQDPRDPEDDPNRYDQIMFFANGDFQSIQLYEYSSGVPDPNGDRNISGNVARIQYGQVQMYSQTEGRPVDPWEQKYERHPKDTVFEERQRTLARRQHILTAEAWLKEWPDDDMSDFPIYENEVYEHDSLSLGQWKLIDASVYNSTVVDTCFDYRPLIDMTDQKTFQETYHKLMCESVVSFAIQWAYWDEDDGRFYWFPSDDPDGDGDDDDSHFELMSEEFGVLFNIPGEDASIYPWEFIEGGDVKYDTAESFESSFYPKALKFTFRLYDSKGIIKKDGERGREFTHIVYLGG